MVQQLRLPGCQLFSGRMVVNNLKKKGRLFLGGGVNVALGGGGGVPLDFQFHDIGCMSTYLQIPGTQMTLVLIGKDLVLEGWSLKIEDKKVPGIYSLPAEKVKFRHYLEKIFLQKGKSFGHSPHFFGYAIHIWSIYISGQMK